VYSYYVVTKGSYNNPAIYSPLLNNSQIDEATPTDTVLPPAPTLTVNGPDCANFDDSKVFNFLHWKNNQDPNALLCRRIKLYKVYFSEYEGDNLALLTSLTDTSYTHLGVPFNLCASAGGTPSPVNSLAGCYAVTAIDSSNNESPKSNIVCVDNCTKYILPNIITPNNDSKNELLKPIDQPRYVICLNYFDIVNRWGGKVASLNTDIELDWNGKSGNNSVPDGVYYYQAEVRFKRLRRSDEATKLKGYFQIIR
jgi:gliding motility-associated-like protein